MLLLIYQGSVKTPTKWCKHDPDCISSFIVDPSRPAGSWHPCSEQMSSVPPSHYCGFPNSSPTLGGDRNCANFGCFGIDPRSANARWNGANISIRKRKSCFGGSNFSKVQIIFLFLVALTHPSNLKNRQFQRTMMVRRVNSHLKSWFIINQRAYFIMGKYTKCKYS